jgi:hypothetical protein
MQIDAKWGVWLNILALVLTAVSAGTLKFTGVSPDVVSIIKDYAFDALVLLTTVNTVLHLYASTNPGPLAPQDKK